MLEAVGLSKAYHGVKALDCLDLKIAPGEVFCLLGANGAGKTTTIKLFLNFITPSAGTARINGVDVFQHPLETKKYVAYIPEQVMFYGNLTGLENLAYFMALSNRPPRPKKDLLNILEQAGLSREAAGRRVLTYSKGMRQKVGIALAMAKNAEALFLDEPTSGLDPKSARDFSDLIGKVSRNGAAVLMVTHDIFHAKETGTDVGIMKQGRLVKTLKTEKTSLTDLEQIYLEEVCDEIDIASAALK